MKLESRRMRLAFCEETAQIASIDNLLAGERYMVEGEKFRIEADEFVVDFGDCVLESAEISGDRVLRAQYRFEEMAIDVVYNLRDHFIEKSVLLKSRRDYTLRKVFVSRPHFAAEMLTGIVPYRYQHNATYFGRTLAGGFYAGMELPFDTSFLDGDRIQLSYRPGLKVKADECFECEPAYFGIYKLGKDESVLNGEMEGGSFRYLPLQSETEAMVAMVSAILGPPRHGPTSVFATLAAGAVRLWTTEDESGEVVNMTGIPGQPTNVTYGDKIRYWARLRRNRQFCPHYLDQAYFFVNVGGGGETKAPWSGENLEYALLSAISASPNQCYFSGPVDAIPKGDRAIIRRWLDWSRENSNYLMVRRDLADWPSAGKTDGSAHIVNDRGFIFLFNPNAAPMKSRFILSEECIGINGSCGKFTITQHYPPSGMKRHASYCAELEWELPPFSSIIVEIVPL